MKCRQRCHDDGRCLASVWHGSTESDQTLAACDRLYSKATILTERKEQDSTYASFSTKGCGIGTISTLPPPAGPRPTNLVYPDDNQQVCNQQLDTAWLGVSRLCASEILADANLRFFTLQSSPSLDVEATAISQSECEQRCNDDSRCIASLWFEFNPYTRAQGAVCRLQFSRVEVFSDLNAAGVPLYAYFSTKGCGEAGRLRR